MESSNWFQGAGYATGNNGLTFGASCTPAEFEYREEEEQQQQVLISSQFQQHLNQIRMHMGMEDEPAVYGAGNGAAAMAGDLLSTSYQASGSFLSSSSPSSSLLSASLSCSPETTAHVLAAPAVAAAACFQYPEVSSHLVLPYEHHGAMAPHGTATAEVPAAGAFRRYARHLAPRRLPKPGACGQRMFKTAMSALAKMHMSMRYRHQQYYYQQQQAAAAVAEAAPSDNQLQHMISERKRREKLNDSFHALKAVLPPGSKKDKTSILITAREYVKSLESKVSELEAQLAGRLAGAKKDEEGTAPEAAGQKVEIDLISSGGAAEGDAPDEITCTLDVAVTSPSSRCGGGGGGISMTDVVLRALQCLRDQMGDGACLVALNTRAGAGGRPLANLTLQLKSSAGAKWEEAAVSFKDSVAKGHRRRAATATSQNTTRSSINGR